MSFDTQRCLAHRTAEEVTKPAVHDNRTSPKLRSSVLLPSQFSGRRFRMIPSTRIIIISAVLLFAITAIALAQQKPAQKPSDHHAERDGYARHRSAFTMKLAT